MKTILSRLKNHFDNLQDRFECFCKCGVQIEGWFKGELLTLSDKMLEEGLIQGFDREIKVGTKRIDFCIDFDNNRHWIELKHWLIGEQKGSYYNTGFYFGDPTSVGIIKDVEKLKNIPFSGDQWLLILMAAKPDVDSWKQGIQKFNSKFSPYHITSYSNPDNFPSTYFLGLLKIN